MKQKDLAIIIVVGIFSAVASLLLSNFVFNNPNSHNLKAPTVDSIEAKFDQPSKKYFNENSIDPTKLIQIGDGPNSAPFNN